MFTGIITATTPIVRATKQPNGGLELVLKIPDGWQDIEPGESIATNGTCLTVTSINDTEYTVFLMPETLGKTIFSGELPEMLNLERSLAIGDRLSGHIVQGHIDTMGTVSKISKLSGYEIFVKFDKQYRPLLVHKGSIALNGASLTIASLTDDIFSVAIIPHTLQHTTLGSLGVGDKVNLEFDIVGKYALNLVKGYNHATR